MININDIQKLLVANGDTHIRVCNLRKEKIIDISGTTPEDAFNNLQSYIPILKGYKKLILKTGSEGSEKANYTNAKSIEVFFPEEYVQTSTQMQLQGPLGGSKELFDTKIELETLKLKNSYEDRFRKLEERDNDPIEKYSALLPFVGAALGWGDEKIERLFKMSMMGKSMQLGRKNTLTIEGTKEEKTPQTTDEKIKQLEQLMTSVCQDPKVGIDKIIKLLQVIEKKPEIVDSALAFLNL